MYPVMLGLCEQRCLVVGGGTVALRKVEGLLQEGAKLTVVAQTAVTQLRDFAQNGRLILHERGYVDSDIDGQMLVFAATNDREVNRAVFQTARAAGIWVNVADDPELCSFHLPARVQRGHLQVCIASDGQAPFAVRRLRRLLMRIFGPEWQDWMQQAAAFRRLVLKKTLPVNEQEKVFERFFANTVDVDKAAARVPADCELESWLDDKSVNASNLSGFVSLVGAGPGDPGLLTLRARKRLLDADAIVYDRLAEPALPIDLSALIELHDVGKQAGQHPVPQHEINSLLVRLARSGKRVVRLKGGDPYVFGRGGEEVLALVEADIAFEIVPGVTSGIAASAYAGIPVTHRGEATRVTLVTAHESSKEQGPQVRWDLLAQDHNATIVGYMGVSSLPAVVEKLINGGMQETTPAAMIMRGTTSAQRSVFAPLSQLVQSVTDAGLQAPALFVIGPAVRLCTQLSWFEKRPMHGTRLALFAPGGDIADALELIGVDVIALPTPLTPAAVIALRALPLSAVLLRSCNEVDAVLDFCAQTEFEHTAVFCLGEAVFQQAQKRNLDVATVVASLADIRQQLSSLKR